MKPKQTLILLVVVAALVAAVLAYEYVVKPERAVEEAKSELFFPDLDKDSITLLDISRGDTLHVVLEKQGDSVWAVETSAGYKADKDAVEKAIDTLADLDKGLISSRSKSSHADLGVGDSGLVIKASAGGKVVAELVAGKNGKGANTSFARAGGSDEVYLVSENLGSIFGKKSGEWRDKSLFSAALDDVMEVTLTIYPEAEGDTIEGEMSGDTAEAEPHTLTITRNPDTTEWEFIAEGDSVDHLDKSKVDGMVKSLINLHVAKFKDDVTQAEAGLDNPTKTAEFKTVDGESHRLLVGSSDGSETYVMVADSGLVGSVYDYNIRGIFKDRAAFEPMPQEQGDFDPSQFLPKPDLATPPPMPMPDK